MGNLSGIPKDTEAKNMTGGCLPKGRYICELRNSETKPTKSGGEMLKLDFQVTHGEFAGQHIFGNLNIINESDKAQQIGRGLLSALSKAVGLASIPDESFELHDRPVEVDISVRVSTDPQYGDQNQIKGFYPATKPKSTATTQTVVTQDIFGDDDISI